MAAIARSLIEPHNAPLRRHLQRDYTPLGGQVQRSFAQALLVGLAALDAAQHARDALAASRRQQGALQVGVAPIVQRLRLDAGGAIDPRANYCASGYRRRGPTERPAAQRDAGGSV